MTPFRMTEVAPGTRLCTRDGRIVADWFIVDNPGNTLLPVRAKCTGPSRYSHYTANGRRYLNVESKDDLFVAAEEIRPERLDTMPDVLAAIRAVRAGDMAGVKSANKDGKVRESDYDPGLSDPTSIHSNSTI